MTPSWREGGREGRDGWKERRERVLEASRRDEEEAGGKEMEREKKKKRSDLRGPRERQ